MLHGSWQLLNFTIILHVSSLLCRIFMAGTISNFELCFCLRYLLTVNVYPTVLKKHNRRWHASTYSWNFRHNEHILLVAGMYMSLFLLRLDDFLLVFIHCLKTDTVHEKKRGLVVGFILTRTRHFAFPNYVSFMLFWNTLLSYTLWGR